MPEIEICGVPECDGPATCTVREINGGGSARFCRECAMTAVAYLAATGQATVRDVSYGWGDE